MDVAISDESNEQTFSDHEEGDEQTNSDELNEETNSEGIEAKTGSKTGGIDMWGIARLHELLTRLKHQQRLTRLCLMPRENCDACEILSHPSWPFTGKGTWVPEGMFEPDRTEEVEEVIPEIPDVIKSLDNIDKLCVEILLEIFGLVGAQELRPVLPYLRGRKALPTAQNIVFERLNVSTQGIEALAKDKELVWRFTRHLSLCIDLWRLRHNSACIEALGVVLRSVGPKAKLIDLRISMDGIVKSSDTVSYQHVVKDVGNAISALSLREGPEITLRGLLVQGCKYDNCHEDSPEIHVAEAAATSMIMSRLVSFSGLKRLEFSLINSRGPVVVDSQDIPAESFSSLSELECNVEAAYPLLMCPYAVQEVWLHGLSAFYDVRKPWLHAYNPCQAKGIASATRIHLFLPSPSCGAWNVPVDLRFISIPERTISSEVQEIDLHIDQTNDWSNWGGGMTSSWDELVMNDGQLSSHLFSAFRQLADARDLPVLRNIRFWGLVKEREAREPDILAWFREKPGPLDDGHLRRLADHVKLALRIDASNDRPQLEVSFPSPYT